MNEKTYEEEASCLEVLNDAVVGKEGIVDISMNTADQRVTIDYDPTRIQLEDIHAVAQGIAPTLHQRWSSCTMRLGKHGGRACESCALQLEKRLHALPGIHRATASYAGGALSVKYDGSLTSPAAIADQVRQYGLDVQPSASAVSSEPETETAVWLTADRLEAIATAVTLLAMGIGFFAERAEAGLVATVAFIIAYLAGGYFGLQAGLESLRDRTIDVDLLMILAAVGAAIVGEPFEGAMLLFLFSLSNVLQTYALDRTRNAIKSLMKLRPNQANVRRGDQIVTLPIEKINIQDRIVVKPGERIALDGKVMVGESAVDQASITGESIPVNKTPGDPVFAGTINKNGHLEIAVTKLAADSTIAKLIQMVEEAQSEKADTQRFIDTAEQYYAIGVIALTTLAIVVPQLFGWEAFSASFYRAMTIMVAASPCALVISTPATVLSAIGNGARRGVLFKGGAYVENAAAIKVVTFDKTGTLTSGKPQVTDVVALEQKGTEDRDRDTQRVMKTNKFFATSAPSAVHSFLQLAAAVEAKSEHPLAEAIVAESRAKGIDIPDATGFQATTGQGVEAMVNGRLIRIGNLRYFQTHHFAGEAEAVPIVEKLQQEGKTSVVVAEMDPDRNNGRLLGVIAIADQLRPNAAAVIQRLKALGVERIVMLTGDNQTVAENIAAQVGVDAVYADLLPEDKVRVIKEVQAQYGPTAMVGDGVNDAPALATANIGIAMGAAGTDVALETADIVLMSDDLDLIPYTIGLSRKTRRVLTANLGFSLFMILLMLATILVSGLALPLAVIGHEGGTVLVSLNGLRLLGYREKLRMDNG